MIQLFELPADLDLGPFAAYLWRQRIHHRITHLQGQQQLWLADPADADFVMEQFNRWQRGEALENSSGGASKQVAFPWWRLPVTLVLIGFSLALTLLTGFGNRLGWLHWFSFVDFDFQGGYLIFQSFPTLLSGGQWWRLLTPIFLHYSLLHLVFNLLWTWELGRRIELTRGSSSLLWLVLFIGISSNAAQFLMTGPLFGGLSGVIFGLMGYTWLSDRLKLGPGFGMPPALMTFMMIWLVLGVSGLIEKMGFGAIANTAHLVGLLAGLVCVLPVWLRRNRPQ
ncbi:rhomboid family intramembrane serine protease [Motiliproteus coralliicola]|uniref:Rhomboid family intramembrane serine protease n=1 Tax=Motiliproteus coralliicola TaxID=2283196 RepID=A0A369WSU9_9GAMM|nr:rhomboid family intramembrane serine protease [Motiliproteus coralliicola]RDE24149.1 rhomboid family intramembrane serine protease [Motiliproteus coralliicola]